MNTNCFFEEFDYSTHVELLSSVKEDAKGYFIEIAIPHTEVGRFLQKGIVSEYVDLDIFKILVALNNNTKFYINDMRVFSLADDRLRKLPINLLSLKELAIRVYSKKTSGHRSMKKYCYATKLSLKLNTKG